MASVGFNQIVVLGTIYKIENRVSTAGNKFCKIVINENKSVKDKETQKWIAKNRYHRCVCFDKLAEYIEKYIAEGDLVLAVGEVEYNSWTNKEGVKVYSTDILPQKLTRIGGKGGGDNRSRDTIREDPDTLESAPGVLDNDLPF